MTLVENIERAATKYAETVLSGLAADGAEEGAPEELRTALIAAYLSGAMQLVSAQARSDGAFPHPSQVMQAIEQAGKVLLGHGSELPVA